MRVVVLAIMGAAIVATLIPVITPPQTRLLWNVSASVPTGLYLLTEPAALSRGDRAVLWPPSEMHALLADRGYLKPKTPLIKTVAAAAGQRVCRIRQRITIDGKRVGSAHIRDSKGRPLPKWRGCQQLRADQLFFMNIGVPESFDGRYFGPVDRSLVTARAVPLWTDERGDGVRVWFADPHHSAPSPTINDVPANDDLTNTPSTKGQ